MHRPNLKSINSNLRNFRFLARKPNHKIHSCVYPIPVVVPIGSRYLLIGLKIGK